MSRLSLYLPSFAADYSGACSVLFDLDFLVVLADAKCCTRNYVNYDEPRWSRDKETTFCAQLRMLDVVLGDEAKLVDRIVEAARESHPKGIALMGSPVPALTGMDVGAIAAEVERVCGIPSLGVPTTGFGTYERGIQLAYQGLYQRFVRNAAKTFARSFPEKETGTPRVNILGLTPLDFADLSMGEHLRDYLSRAGLRAGVVWSEGYLLDELPHSVEADANLVVSTGGLPLAQRMQRDFGIPWVAAVPYGGTGPSVAQLLWQAVQRTAPSGALSAAGVPFDFAGPCGLAGEAASTAPGAALVVGDWVAACSVRDMLRADGWEGPVVAASFFGKKPDWAEEGDAHLAGERSLADLVGEGRFAFGVGDSLLQRIPGVAALPWAPWVHPAVSSHLHR